jgi:hypothetical protein
VALALLRQEMADAAPDTSIPRELAEELVIGAFLSLLVFWLENRTKHTPPEVDAHFQRFVTQGIIRRRVTGTSAKARRN